MVHEINQEKNGELTVRVPNTVSAAFNKTVKHDFTTGIGNYNYSNGVLNIKAPGTFGAASAGKMPDTCKMNATVSFEKIQEILD
ncbi:MAG: hypothetical protein WKG06_14835 [Segetibacter sp.]